MTKDEGMPKSERPGASSDDSFWHDGAGLVREAQSLRHSGFIILSSFDIRISSFSRL